MISDSGSQVSRITLAPISLPILAAAIVSGVFPLWQDRQTMEFFPKSLGVLWTNSLLLIRADFRFPHSFSMKVLAGYRAPREPPQPTKYRLLTPPTSFFASRISAMIFLMSVLL